MPTFDRCLVIANPASGAGRAGRALQRVVDVLREGGLPAERLLTDHPGHAREATGAFAGGSQLAVCVGGDGTINEVINGAPLDRTVVAVVPRGTGNVLAGELGMPRRAAAAARTLLTGRLHRMDLGECNGRRFVCMVGAGIDAHVVHAMHAARGDRLTQWHYVPVALRALVRLPGWGIDVSADGRTVARGVRQVVVGNTHNYGGPMELTPAAAHDDGLLDAMCARIAGPADASAVSARAFTRSLHLGRGVRYARAERFHLTAARGRVPLQLDGEPAGHLPAQIRVLPGALQVLAPRRFVPRPRRLP